MDAHLEDLRILRLAAMYEDAYESFVQRMADEHLDDATRALLAPLRPERDHHVERVRALIDRIERQIPAEKRAALQRAVVRDIVEVERAAREFYLGHLDKVHDKDVVQLFHRLAAEERRHAETAERALVALGPEERDDATVRDPFDIPSWEGTGETRRKPRRRGARTAR